MLSSITPVGEASRKQRWWITTSAYVLASATGGALVGGLLGGLGSLLLGGVAPELRLAGVTVLALVGLLLDLGVGGLRLPSWQRQVDERWLTTYRGWVYGAGFGFQLGTGVLTIVPTSLTYVVLALAAATADLTTGATVGLVFGLARALPLLATRRVRTPAALMSAHRRLDALGATADGVVRIAQAALLVVVPLSLLSGGA